jgi:hypothetical protein
MSGWGLNEWRSAGELGLALIAGAFWLGALWTKFLNLPRQVKAQQNRIARLERSLFGQAEEDKIT